MSNPDITAARYNNLQARINEVLGNGALDTGYGQSVKSSQVRATGAPSSSVLAEDIALRRVVNDIHMNTLYQDMISARIHQVGFPVPTDIAPVEEGANIELSNGNGTGIVQYEQFMDVIEQEKLLINFDTQSNIELAGDISNIRSTPWNGSVVHQFTATFTDFDARRHFFNAGGTILFNMNLTGGSGIKTDTWRNLVSQAGVISFNYNSTSSTNTNPDPADITTVINSVGNYQLNGFSQTLFKKTIISGDYQNNNIEILAKEINPQVIEFSVIFDDSASLVGGFDENITGVLSSVIQIIRPVGVDIELELGNGATLEINDVELPSPAFSNITILSSGGDVVPLPESYVLEANRTIVREGQTVTVTLNTANVDNGTDVDYLISGVSADDISGISSLEGTFTVNNNQASVTFTIADDDLVDEQESLILTLTNGQSQVQIPIQDTSVPPAAYSLSANKTQVNEGESITFTLTYSNNSEYDTLPLLFGLTNEPDLDFRFGTGSEQFSLIKAVGTFTSTITKTAETDNLTEGPETKTVYLASREEPLSTLTFNIIDTSLDAQSTFDLQAQSTVVQAGTGINLILTTTNVNPGETVGYTITGDLDALQNTSDQTGTFLIAGSSTSGTASKSIPTKSTISETQDLIIRLNNNEDSVAVTVNPLPVELPDPDPACVNPANRVDARAEYRVDNAIVFNNGEIFYPIDIVVTTFDSRGSTIRGWYDTYLQRLPDEEGFNFWYDEWENIGEAATLANFLGQAEVEQLKNGSTVMTFCQYQAYRPDDPDSPLPLPSDPTDPTSISNVQITPSPVLVYPNRQPYLSDLPSSIRNQQFAGFSNTVITPATLRFTVTGGNAFEVQGDIVNTPKARKTAQGAQQEESSFSVDYRAIPQTSGTVESAITHTIIGYEIDNAGVEQTTRKSITTPVKYKPVKHRWRGIGDSDTVNFADNALLVSRGIETVNGVPVYDIPEGAGSFTFVPSVLLEDNSGDGAILIEIALESPSSGNDARMLKGFRSFGTSSQPFGYRDPQAARENRWYVVPYFLGAERTDGIEFGRRFNLAVDFDFTGYEAGDEITWTIVARGAPVYPFTVPQVNLTYNDHIRLTGESGSDTETLPFRFRITGNPYTYENWANEFRDSYDRAVYNRFGRAKILEVGTKIANAFYLANTNYGAPLGFGLNRKPDAGGLFYWTKEALTRYNGDVLNSIFVQTIFTAAQVSNNRDTIQNRNGNLPFEQGRGVGDFGDRKLDSSGRIVKTGFV